MAVDRFRFQRSRLVLYSLKWIASTDLALASINLSVCFQYTPVECFLGFPRDSTILLLDVRSPPPENTNHTEPQRGFINPEEDETD